MKAEVNISFTLDEDDLEFYNITNKNKASRKKLLKMNIADKDILIGFLYKIKKYKVKVKI